MTRVAYSRVHGQSIAARRVESMLAAIGSKLCHDAINDWVEHVLRQLERIAFGHDLYCLARRVVHFLDAHGLSGKDLAEIDFFLAETDAARIARPRWFCRAMDSQCPAIRCTVEDVDELSKRASC
jgi:hypothetical protein